MYLEFYRLDREPFHITPDPDFLFPSPSHNEALAAIVYGVEKRKGFVALTGEVGTGKTTILRAYLRREEGTDIRPIYLFHPDLSFRDLLIKLSRELGLDTGESSNSELLEHLQGQLIDEYRENRTPVLIIDEAQNMPIETLEQLRMLTNLETSKDKLLQVVLVGQPELEEILDQHSLRQLKQRISVRSNIQPLTPPEAAAYVRSRVERAGSDSKYLFSEAAIKEVVRVSNGIPRTINTLCDNALIAGYGMQQRPVPPKTVREAARDLQLGTSSSSSFRPGWAVAAVAAIVAGAGGAYWMMNSTSPDPTDSGAYSSTSAETFNDGEIEDAAPTPVPEEPASEPVVNDDVPPETPPVAREVSSAAPAANLDPVDSLTAELRSRVVSQDGADNPPKRVDATPVEPETAAAKPVVDVPAPVAISPVAVQTPSPEPQKSREALARTVARPLSDKVGMITRVVQPGDCLSKLITDVYGTENYQEIMPEIMRQNPRISDPDALTVGLSIEFPESLNAR
jgi:general secretion pathway protein A